VEDQVAERPSTVAIIALVVSILTASFSIFQWWTADKELRKTAAIEFSMKFLADEKLEVGFEAVGDSHAVKYDGNSIGEASRYLKTIEYMSWLINTGRYDASYVAPAVLCNIFFTYSLAAGSPIPAINAAKVVEMKKIHDKAAPTVCG
jgi:hypothetical protein